MGSAAGDLGKFPDALEISASNLHLAEGENDADLTALRRLLGSAHSGARVELSARRDSDEPVTFYLDDDEVTAWQPMIRRGRLDCLALAPDLVAEFEPVD